MRVPEIVGRRVREARKDLGFSQAQLGETLGAYLDKPWFPQAVSEAEAGRRNFSAEELFVLGIVLNRPVSWFFLPLHFKDRDIDLPRSSVDIDEVWGAWEGPLQGAGSPLAALLVEGRAMATAFNYSAREMEHRSEAFIRIAEQLVDASEVTSDEDEDEPPRLVPWRRADEA